jgi:transcriptional regulator with XRE-family HTH domain
MDVQRDALLVAEARLALRSGRASEIRRAAGLSQIEVAAVCGVADATYCRWESGERAPRAEAAIRLGRFLRALGSTIEAGTVAQKREEPALTGSLASPADADGEDGSG